MGLVRSSTMAILVGGLIFGYTASLSPAQASPKSSALIDEGIALLNEDLWNRALVSFLAAAVADPKDAEAQFFQGVALNRLGSHRAALGQIERARKANVENSDMDFEYGWALLGSARFEDAISALKAYKTTNPESGKASELIGRAELSLGNETKGEAALAEAVRLDPKLQASVDFFRAAIAAERGDTIAQAELLDAVVASKYSGPLSRTTEQTLALQRAILGTPKTKPWTVFGSVAVGHNNNVIALSDAILRPVEITRTDSRYFDLTGGGDYRLGFNPTQSVTVGGFANRRNYRDINGSDTDTLNIFGRFDEQVSRRLLASVATSFTHVRVDGDKAQNTVAISPSLQYQVNNSLRVGVSYTGKKVNLPSPNATPASLDRDSKLHTLAANIVIGFPSLRSDITIGAARLNNSAVGGDYDYNGTNYSVAVRTQLPWEVIGSVGINRTNYDFKNLNSLAPTTPPGPTGFGFRREDAVTNFTASLVRPINETYTAYVRASRTNANSNLTFFTYDQKDFQIGVTARF